ncbi:MAG: trypsin-like peptidase domain-containing protein [Patescibacteria group bacterium]|nr:trypsin-like peptidase domain-containing protein [Patescibacteria group bacterium]MDE2438533.1 trypsin-like peptidase domain-containing protein [Patescibacteria group bacterium]
MTHKHIFFPALILTSIISGLLCVGLWLYPQRAEGAIPYHMPGLLTILTPRFIPSLISHVSYPSTLMSSSVSNEADLHEERVINVIHQAMPGVVSIVVSKNEPVYEEYYTNPWQGNATVNNFFGGQIAIPNVRQNGTQLKEVGEGSGFIVSPNGLIVTNKHVVSDPTASYTVYLNDGQKFDATVLARDPFQDMAVVKIPAKGLASLVLGDSDTAMIGQTVIAIGNALAEFRNTASEGIISGLARTVTAQGANTEETLQGLIQTDAAINEGNSGGPLLNLKGEVIGVNAALAQGAQSIGFAIPINNVKRAIEDVATTGKISTPYIGVRYVLITKSLKDTEHLSVDEGALVRGDNNIPAVIKGSPADKAGIKEGDIILSVNGALISQEKSLTDIISQYKVGDVITLKVLRGKDEEDVSMLLVERPHNL